MCDFKPGDEVVCVDASECGELIEGRAYTIRDVFRPGAFCRDAFGNGGIAGAWGVDLAEVKNPRACRAGYRAERFRKVQRRKTDLSVEAFLTIKPGFEEPRRPAPAKKRERA